MQRSKLGGVLFAALALGFAAIPVSADSRDIDQGFQLSFNPCLADPITGQLFPPTLVAPSPGPGNDGAVHICFVNIGMAGESWVAATGEWILFRVRTGNFASEADCASADPTATAQVDGVAVPVDVSCQERPNGAWIASFRILSRPLSVGSHSVGLTFSLGGSTATATDSVNVIQG